MAGIAVSSTTTTTTATTLINANNHNSYKELVYYLNGSVSNEGGICAASLGQVKHKNLASKFTRVKFHSETRDNRELKQP